MVNGQGSVWVERLGELRPRRRSTSRRAEVDLLVERIVGPLGLRADRTSPIADARLPDGSRVNVVVPPLAVDGPCITIRRFGARRIPLGALCPPGVDELLAWAVARPLQRDRERWHRRRQDHGARTRSARSCPTASASSRSRTPPSSACPPPTSCASRRGPPPPTASGATTIRQLVRNALRMRPDRIIVGEVRGPEAVDMLWAMNTGHEGSLSTCHANSPLDALRRLEVMVLSAGLDLPMAAVRDQLSSALDLVVQVARTGGGARSIVAVAEVIDPPRPTAAACGSSPGPTGLHDLPLRAPRAPGAPPPDPGWCT